MQTQNLAQAACLVSAQTWRFHAAMLRASAQHAYLADERRADLEGEAEAADRQADAWLDGAEET